MMPEAPSPVTSTLCAVAIGLALLDVVLALPRRPDAPHVAAPQAPPPSTTCAQPPQLPPEIQDMLGHD